MSSNSHPYEFLDEHNIADYIACHPALAGRVDAHHIAHIEEIGDGNLNLVFRVRDENNASIILKQALPYVRMTGEAWPMTPERARHEAESLAAHHAAIPDLVVETLLYDSDRYVLAMEDLGDHLVWRTALNQGLRHHGAASAAGRYVAAVAWNSSVFGLERSAVSEACARTQNPELCTLTEDLVFTEPVFDAGRNFVLPANEVDAAALAADPALRAALAEGKWRFMTQAESLIHGDLHTGSIMVRRPQGSDIADSVKVFDSEFAFYGPVGFDLGALLANYSFAAARAFALGETAQAEWAMGCATETLQSFASEIRIRAAESAESSDKLETNTSNVQSADSESDESDTANRQHRNRLLWDAGFVDHRIGHWSREAWLFACAKMARRIVGAAKVSDIETLPEELRAGAARGVLRASRTVAARWDAPHSPEDFAATVLPVLRETIS